MTIVETFVHAAVLCSRPRRPLLRRPKRSLLAASQRRCDAT
jgi:hypothetical protein